MRLFSERKGLKKPKTKIQVDSIDDELRNGLWDIVTVYYFHKIKEKFLRAEPNIESLLEGVWHNVFKRPIDTIDPWGGEVYSEIREYFFACTWSQVYDFVEFLPNMYRDDSDPENELGQKFMDSCNSVLKREVSAYRFVGGKITEITSKEEISVIEEGLDLSGVLAVVRGHLKRALDLFSDRKSPDYRNSIKESISAVEAICRLVSNNKNATLGVALDLIEKQAKVNLHPALKGAFDKLYGYTSTAGGIRHGTILDESEVDFEIAKFMLVTCSAFVNYLVSKSSKAGSCLAGS